jgi:hypothetical protein
MVSGKVTTDHSVAAYLAGTSLPKKHGSKKDKTSQDKALTLLREFTAGNLYDILVDPKGNRIDLKWLVQRLVEITFTGKASERLMALDRLKEFVLLGAIQEKDLADAMTRGGKAPSENQFDPFALKLKDEKKKPSKKKRRSA